MSRRSQPRVSLVALSAGLAAAGIGAAVGVAAERVTMGRPILPRMRGQAPAPAGRASGVVDAAPGSAAVPLGSLRGTASTVRTDDGVDLYVEVDEPDPGGDPLTVVFSHGYALSLDSWHFQRLALRGEHRLVLWDQRGHGRSGTGPGHSVTIDRVGRDLAHVLDAVAAEGPLVLVGHSMGGMTVMALAEQRPELFAERIPAVALVATSAGGLGHVNFGMPRLGPLVQRFAPAAVQALSRTPGLVERGRRLGSDLEAVIVRRYSYASPVPEELVRFSADMIAATRLEVLSTFLPAFSAHDKRQALATLAAGEVLVLAGTEDLMTPLSHSEEIAGLLPGAEHVVVPAAGHLVMLEHPDVVTSHLLGLLRRAREAGARRAGSV